MQINFKYLLKIHNRMRLVLSFFSLLCVFHVKSQVNVEAQWDSCSQYVISNPQKTIRIAEAMLKTSETDYVPVHSGKAHYYLGAGYHQLNDQDLAIYHFSKATDIFSEIMEKEWLGKSLRNLGIVYRDNHEYEQALRYLDRASELFLENSMQKNHIEVLFISGSIFAKQGNFEQAVNQLQKAAERADEIENDSLKARSFSHLTLLYRDKGAFKEALENERKAAELHRNTNNMTALAASFNLQGSIYWRMNNFSEAEKTYLKAIHLRQEINDDVARAKSMENLARVYKDWQRVNKADSITQLAVLIYRKNGDSLGVASAYKNLGNIFFEQNNLIKAMHFYLKALKIYEAVNNTDGIVSIQKNLGTIYEQIGDYQKSLEYYHIALEKEEEDDDILGVAYMENLIGKCLMKMARYDEALKSYNSALRRYKNLGHEKNMAVTYNLMGDAYFQQENTEMALRMFGESKEHAHNARDFWRISTEWNNIGNVYLATNNHPKAMHAFQSAYAINKEIDNDFGTALCGRKIGEIHDHFHNEDSAFFYLDESLRIGESIANKELIKNASFALYKFFEDRQNYKQALIHYRHFSEVSDSIYRESNSDYMAELQLSQKILEKDNLINQYLNDRDILLAENHLKRVQLIKKNAVQYVLIVVVVASLIISFLLFNRYRLKRRYADKLDEQIRIIGNTNNALADSEAQLLSINATKNKFFSVLAHDLRNPLTGIITASTTLQNNYETFEDRQKKGFIEIINASARQLENLVTNLLHWSKTQTGHGTFQPVKLNLRERIEEVFKFSEINASKKDIEMKHGLDGSENVYADKEMLTTVIRNLVSNAIKYSNDGGNIKVYAIPEEDVYVISVTDTGIGISPGNLKKLFKFDEKISTYGTDDEVGSGLGLLLSKEFVEKNGGKIWVDKTSKQGTTFKFTVPINQ